MTAHREQNESSAENWNGAGDLLVVDTERKKSSLEDYYCSMVFPIGCKSTKTMDAVRRNAARKATLTIPRVEFYSIART